MSSAPRPVELAGRVVDAAGRGVPDAMLLAFSLAGDGLPVRATSDLDGAFRIRATAGSYRLLVEAPGFPLAARTPVEAPASDLSIALAGEGRAIAGRVVQDGAPVGGATVRLAAEAGGPERRPRTGPDGRFYVAALGEGTYAVRAATQTLVSPTERGVAAAAGDHPVTLALQPGREVAGRVTENGSPAAGVEVRAEDRSLGPGEDPLPELARSDATGSFTLGPLAPGRYRVTAARPGWLLRRAGSIELGADGGVPAPVAMELLQGARLTGRVSGPSGAPLAGARVRCFGADVDDLTVRPGTLPLAAEAAALSPATAGGLGAAQDTLTDGHGRFALDGLLPGRYRVAVSKDGYQPADLAAALGAGERRDLGALTLAQGLAVQGRVVDQTGAPLEAVRVAVSSALAGSSPLPGAVTDGAGQFSLVLGPGHYRVTAAAEGRGSASADLTADGAAQPVVELRLSRADATLEGVVRDSAGRPLAHARLTVRPAALTAAAGETPAGSATADAGGHFRITGLPQGELRLDVRHPDYAQTSAPVVTGQFATIVIPMPGGVAGEVRARATGALVPHARIEATGPDGATATADTKAVGRFRLLRLAPGRWRIRATTPKMRSSEQEIEVPSSPTLGDPSVRDLRIDLDAA